MKKKQLELGNDRILIAGASGFGKETLTCVIDCFDLDVLKLGEKICFLETEEFCKKTSIIKGIPVISTNQFVPNNFQVVVGIGDPSLRRKIVEELPKETRYLTLVHPSAVVSKWVEIGEGSIVTAGTIITVDVKIGKHAHLNLHTTIGHDCTIGDYFTTAPGVNVSGLCNIGNAVYLGSNCVVKQDVSICDNVTVGMGSVVTKNIKEQGVYIGAPSVKV